MAWTDRPDRHRWARCALLAALPIVTLLGACSVAGPKRSPLPQEGPNLVDVYRDHITREGAGAAADSRPTSEGAKGAVPMRPDTLTRQPMTVAMRAATQPVDQRFRRLPNPDLVMYVFPHLAKGRYPVPGYFTVFPMYESIEYAMPGESIEDMPRDLRPDAAPAAAKAATSKPAAGHATRVGATTTSAAQ